MERNVIDRFWNKVHITDHCWYWIGAIGKWGYGNFWNGQRFVKAHRFAYELIYGDLEHFGLHTCDNRRCVNPTHIFDGTQKDNMDDMNSKGRRAIGNAAFKWDKVRIGEQHHNARLSITDVNNLVADYTTGNYSQRTVAIKYGISREHARDIINGKKWVRARNA
jgi:hypothetical protein